MTFYLLLLSLTLASLFLIKGKAKVPVGIFLFILMLFLCGLRGYNVGTDTFEYHYHYKHASSERIEPFFMLFRSICHVLDFNVQGFLFAAAALAYIPLIILLKRESKNLIFSALIYQTFSVLFFHQTFNTVRACIAISFMLWGIYFLAKESRWSKFILFSILSSLFHYSAVVIIIIICIFHWCRFFKPLWIYLAIFSSVLFGYVFTTGFSDFALQLSMLGSFESSVALDYYNSHLSHVDEMDMNLVGLSASLLPFSIITLLLCNKNNCKSLYYKLFVIGCVLQNIFISVVLVYRITMYFTLVLVFLLPNTYAEMNRIRKNGIIGMSLFFIMWYVYQLFKATTSNMTLAETVPYYMFFND